MDQEQIKVVTKKIKIFGMVQGVGFRPLVFRHAGKYGIKGTVRNIGGIVEIIANAPEQKVADFLKELQENGEEDYEIVHIQVEDISEEFREDVRENDGEDASGNDGVNTAEDVSGNDRENIAEDVSGNGGENTAKDVSGNDREKITEDVSGNDRENIVEDVSGNDGENTAKGSSRKDVKYDAENIREKIIQGDKIHYKDFRILNSAAESEISILPPDLPVCNKCKKELYESGNRRYKNPFISCTSCGPRYTIMEHLPYDRHTTTMKEFPMCEACNKEYTDPESRRFHAQTISCNDCGPYVIFQDLEDDSVKEKDENNKVIPDKKIADAVITDKVIAGKLVRNKAVTDKAVTDKTITEIATNKSFLNEEAITKAVSILKSGGILAVKGIGGYHYVCSPMSEETVLNLRRLKGREEKPFAVMFPDLEAIEEYCMVSEEERELLLSKARPIVLLYTRNDSMAEATNKGGIYCGAFLPYTPLQILLTRHCGPLIMTSANRSGAPIIKDDIRMLEVKSPYLKGILYHKRRIVRSVDDSVAKVIDGKPQLIRRSRGYVPYPVFINPDKEVMENTKRERCDTAIFAAGGDLKAAFCLYKKGSAVVSQYFGDLEEQTVLEEYKKSYEDLSGLLNITPGLAVCDLHPNYHSGLYARTLNLPVLAVQHHHAHIASVMAEHDLKGPVIGVAFDGTGYGTDGNIWGGEFLVCKGAGFTRAAQLSYTPILGGDSSMKDGKKTATCFLLQAGLKEEVKDERVDLIKAALDNKINTVLTSSMGRLFDVAASLLDICQENRYEGEGAALLEKEAVLAVRNHLEPENLTFAICKKSGIIEIDPKPVIKAISTLRGTRSKASLALGFHYSVANAVLRVCEIIREEQNMNTVALSGGVFQNTILTERVLKLLREADFSVYVNMAVPPNDGSISLGQTYIGLMSLT